MRLTHARNAKHFSYTLSRKYNTMGMDMVYSIKPVQRLSRHLNNKAFNTIFTNSSLESTIVYSEEYFEINLRIVLCKQIKNVLLLLTYCDSTKSVLKQDKAR